MLVANVRTGPVKVQNSITTSKKLRRSFVCSRIACGYGSDALRPRWLFSCPSLLQTNEQCLCGLLQLLLEIKGWDLVSTSSVVSSFVVAKTITVTAAIFLVVVFGSSDKDSSQTAIAAAGTLKTSDRLSKRQSFLHLNSFTSKSRI